ncbi:hypothetical protein GCM10012275_56500 [Longimycelium tulufanense]|uniref:Uncharacterized protein n=1 Tax=Longimycelium tulufanense TaxID=907463 RepID=A0A8J3CJT3_9PSEU|nr:hypothetical protein [Longimycelium tulufanense]GGM78576.1 hypothetical protein GCM10012275_56500 [Longimycelium tulufanense]
MSLRDIFGDTQRMKRRDTVDVVGRLRSGMMVNRRPVALEQWRFTTGDPDVAGRIAALYGGPVEEWDATGEDDLQVLTQAAILRVVIPSPKWVRGEMKLFGRRGVLRACDGTAQTDGKPCACPQQLEERKEAAREGTGCEPAISIGFRLVDAPELGLFRYQSGSWTLLRELPDVMDALAEIDGPAWAELGLERIEWTPKGGTQTRSFVKTSIRVLGAAEEVEN